MPTKIVLKMLRSHVALLAWMLGVLCLVSLTSGFSHGASTTACVDMKPKHISAHPQDPHSNFISVHTDKSTYLPGDKIPVTIRSTRDFMGFLMQARRVADDQVAGTFILISSGSKLLKCSKDGDTVTHSDKSLKRNLSFIWKAPDQLTGNIKLFVSAVQSYFVYWARVGSGPISEQKQNDSILMRNEELKETFPASVYNNTTGRTVPFTEGYLRPEAAHVESYLPELFGYSQDHSPATQQSSLDLDQNAAHLQPSLNPMSRETLTDIQTMESNFLLKTREFGNTQSEDILNSDFYQAFQPCMNCSDTVQVTSTMVDSGSSAVISLSIKTGQEYSTFWFVDFTSREVMDWAPTDVQDTKNPVGKVILSSGRVPKREDINPTLTENQLTSHGASANFLQLAENSASRADLGKVVRNMSLGVTQTIEKENDSGRGGSPAKGTDLGIPQLGILLGCSAALGMALAVGLRHLFSQHCRKHTEVSFRDPDSSIISVGESGELVHVRKIRENSFVLVQAEYNVIAPSATPGK
ncbi:reelin domain-containing protein 1-like [Scyliorhinus torazame]|uniref:Reelin domain-containing protein n=1 Tax=Scyliorhinus torazame TaxID=75743 RepID=A0A401NJ01_SCYTO|nr:hypothetical protein [Scyliorhinus torazame]